MPAQFGIPWANHQISLSFVPDGTLVEGVTSNLSAYFAAGGVANTAWQGEVFRAVQAWSAAADVTVGQVSDSGVAIGVAGRPQHDSRFGDIRVSGRPLSSDVLAITVPPGPGNGTRAGDIIINTAQPITIGGGSGQYDLYTFMLQETGHALGIGNSANIGSPMFEWYQGVRAGIIAEDTTHLVNLYGLPQSSGGSATSSVLNDNHTDDVMATAHVLAGNSALPGTYGIGAVFVDASDMDVYKIAVPGNAGVSPLLTASIGAMVEGIRPTLTVRDSTGAAVPFNVVRNSDGLYSLQAHVAAGQDVYLMAAANSLGTAVAGDYHLDASFNIAATSMIEYIGGTLTQADSRSAQSFTVRFGAVKHFVLTASSANPTNDFGAVVVIKDADGNRVLQFSSIAGSSASANVFLAPGDYTMFVVGKSRRAGALLPDLAFSVRGYSLSDPSGPTGGSGDTTDDDEVGPPVGDAEDTWGDIDDWVPLGS